MLEAVPELAKFCTNNRHGSSIKVLRTVSKTCRNVMFEQIRRFYVHLALNCDCAHPKEVMDVRCMLFLKRCRLSTLHYSITFGE